MTYTPTQLALALDRIALTRDSQAVPGVDYNFGITDRPQPTPEELDDMRDMSPEDRRNAMPKPIWGVTHWDASKLGTQPADEELELDAANPPVPVPKSIISWQAQAALKLTPFGEGTLYDAVIAALDGMEDGAEKIVAQTAFEKDARFNRDSPTINGIATALELDKEAVDALFILGDSLEV